MDEGIGRRATRARIWLAYLWRYQSRFATSPRWGTYGLRTGKYRRYRRYRREDGTIEVWAA